jgi:ribosomal protein S18 acetylase RimI-like enzyme
MDGLRIRAAVEADVDRIAEIISGEPSREAIGICGDERLARRFGMGFVRLPGSPQGWRPSTVAEIGDRVVGVIQAGHGEDMGISVPIALLAVRTFGPFRLPGVLRRLRTRLRVQTQAPPGAYHIRELHVDPALRNRGIGGALLDWADDQARGRGHSLMSLSTTTANPARRLYERHGFRVAETRKDEGYERVTGIEGRVLMVKELA